MVALLLALMGTGAPVGAGPPGFADHARLRAEVQVIGQSPSAERQLQQADSILEALELAPLAEGEPTAGKVRPFTETGGARVEMVDLRLLLTQIAIQTGARDHQVLRAAQGSGAQKIILLRGGFVTLPGLVAMSQGTAVADHVRATPGGVILSRPLAIWSDAGLHLGPADVLALDGRQGSFLTNLGWLDLSGGTVLGNTTANPFAPVFRPFVLTAGLGRMTVHDATLKGLGFGDAPAFGGVAVVNSGLVQPAFASRIIDSALTDVATLSITGTTGAVIAGNHLAGAQGTAVLVSHSVGATITGNTLANLSGPQAIRVTAGSRTTLVTRNILTAGARTGILVDQDSQGVTIAGNLILSQGATGVAITDARCVTIGANLIALSGGAGLGLRASDWVTLAGNAVLFNGGAGILIRDQAEGALSHLSGNVLRGNREGLRGATPGRVVLDGNDLRGQLPRVFTGDLAPRMVNWLRRGQADPAPETQTPTPCMDEGRG